MTAQTRLERTLPTILDELAAGPSPEYLDDVFARTAPMRQRPGWTFPERWLPMADITRSRAFAPAPPWRLLVVALLAIALVGVAIYAYAGAQRHVPAPFGPARNGLIPYETNGDIFVGDPVTGSIRSLVGGPTDDHDPEFSPDGTRISFFRSTGTIGELFTIRPDGTDLRRVFTDPDGSIAGSVWTPDSGHFAVVRLVNGFGQLDILDLDGNAQNVVANDYQVSSMLFRPPLGHEVLFRGAKNGVLSLFAMNADGSNIHEVVSSNGPPDNRLDLGGAAYSADGTRIFYQSAVESSPENQCCQLWVVDADGGNPHRFTSDVAAKDVWEGQPVVSPDGRWVASGAPAPPPPTSP